MVKIGEEVDDKDIEFEFDDDSTEGEVDSPQDDSANDTEEDDIQEDNRTKTEAEKNEVLFPEVSLLSKIKNKLRKHELYVKLKKEKKEVLH